MRNGFATASHNLVSGEILPAFVHAGRPPCSIWLSLIGARGVSLLFAAGDGGVGDWGLENRTENLCFSNDGRNVTKFLPGKNRPPFLLLLPILMYHMICSFSRLVPLVSSFASTRWSRRVMGVIALLLDVWFDKTDRFRSYHSVTSVGATV